VDRADVAESDVIEVAKQSQIPQAKVRKYERTVGVSSPFGSLATIPAALNPFASKKRRRKKKDGGGEEPKADKKKKKAKSGRSDAPKSAAEAFERLRQIGSYGY
jgi:hypothetical protein